MTEASVEAAMTEAATVRPMIGIRAPASGELLREVPAMTGAEVREAVARARVAQAAWGALPVEDRAHSIQRLGEALVDHADELVDLLVRECGKPRNEALTLEVFPTVDFCHHLSRHAARILADQPIELHLLKHRRSYLHYVPLGVVGVISPWNFPLVLAMSPVIEALVAGNAVVVKPSELTPLALLRAREIAVASGLPADLFQVVTGYGDTGAALIDAGIQKMVFTGAVATGRRVGAACAERLIPCVLELGGKAPLLACQDCDVEFTARAIVFGGFANAGQVCISVERVFAHEAIYDDLVARVATLARALRQGDPATEAVDVGAMTMPRQLEVVEALVRDAASKGARVATGGARTGRQSFQPTVLADCGDDMRVMHDEIFGPVVPIRRVHDDEEALRLANDSPLGLFAYVFSRDPEHARELAERLEAGTVMINDVLSAYAAVEAPFGGIKNSGYGRVHADDSLRGMCQARHINYEAMPLPARNPVWYPHGPTKYRLARSALKMLFGRHGVLGRLVDLF